MVICSGFWQRSIGFKGHFKRIATSSLSVVIQKHPTARDTEKGLYEIETVSVQILRTSATVIVQIGVAVHQANPDWLRNEVWSWVANQD